MTTTKVKSAFQFLTTTTLIAGGYVAMEVINHTLLFGYLQTWLVGLGLSATTITVILYAILALTLGLISYLAWKFYVSKRSVR